VRQLDSWNRALLTDKFADLSKRLGLFFIPQSTVTWADPTLGSNSGRFDHHQAGAADRTAAVMHQVPVVGNTLNGRVLAHRGDENPVANVQ